MTATRIYLVRHGSTELSAEDFFAGETDVPLSDVGRAQLTKLASRLAGEGWEIRALGIDAKGATVVEGAPTLA